MSTKPFENRPYRALLVGAIAAVVGLLLCSTGSESLQSILHRATGRGYTYRGIDVNPLFVFGIVGIVGGVGLVVQGVVGLLRRRSEPRARPQLLDAGLGVGLVAVVLAFAASVPQSAQPDSLPEAVRVEARVGPAAALPTTAPAPTVPIEVAAGRGNYPVLASGMSCEGAQARYVEEYRTRGEGVTPDLSVGAYGGTLNSGAYLNSCRVPPNMEVNICAAVQNGRAVGVTVSTRPSNPRTASCVAGAVRGLAFPAQLRLDVTRSTFAGN